MNNMVLDAATLLILFMVFALLVFMVLAAAAAQGEKTRSEGFAFILVGPLPILLRGKPWIALVAAAAILVFLLLVMLR